ncbi:MAG: pilus assembly protein TadE [Burkholderiaceae bacterium]|nr:pilus assembly protein TadE [Burkholderiaceae bacterium]
MGDTDNMEDWRRRRNRDRFSIRSRAHGSVVVMTAVLLVVLIGFTALAVDIGRLMVVRNELQNAADAAALVGASKLSTAPLSITDAIWSDAETAGKTAIKLNKSDRKTLVNASAVGGYWDITQGTPGLQSKTVAVGPNDKPGIQVTVSRKGVDNDGPVTLFLAPILGVNTSDVSAVATAILAPIGGAYPGQLFPVAISKCLFDNFWDSSTNTPKTATTTDPLPGDDLPQVVGRPYEFRIGSTYHYDPCKSGQWTSFQTDNNDVPTIRDLIDNGNPTPLAMGDEIWIQPGTRAALYSAVPVPSEWCVPVVVDVDTTTHTRTPILAFATFHIDESVGGSDKYIKGHFVPNVTCGGFSVGPSYGTYALPRLAQ